MLATAAPHRNGKPGNVVVTITTPDGTILTQWVETTGDFRGWLAKAGYQPIGGIRTTSAGIMAASVVKAS